MKIVRFILGKIILLCNMLLPPRSIVRSEEDQKYIDQNTQYLKLYQFNACPFCVKIRRVIKRLDLKIEIRDVLKNPQFEQELIEKGGKRQVPCLRIMDQNGSVEWLYESSAIQTYLENKFTVVEK